MADTKTKSYEMEIPNPVPSRDGSSMIKMSFLMYAKDGLPKYYITDMRNGAGHIYRESSQQKGNSDDGGAVDIDELVEQGEAFKGKGLEKWRFVPIGAVKYRALAFPYSDYDKDNKCSIIKEGNYAMKSRLTLYGFFLEDLYSAFTNRYGVAKKGDGTPILESPVSTFDEKKKAAMLVAIDFKTYSAGNLEGVIKNIQSGKVIEPQTGEPLSLHETYLTIKKKNRKTQKETVPEFVFEVHDNKSDLLQEDRDAIKEWMKDTDEAGRRIYTEQMEKEVMSWLENHTSSEFQRITFSPRFVSSKLFDRPDDFVPPYVNRVTPGQGVMIAEKMSVSSLEQVVALASQHKPVNGYHQISDQAPKALEAADESNVTLEDL